MPNGKILWQKTSDFNSVLTLQGRKGGFSGLLRRFFVCFRQGKAREGKDAKGGGGRAYVKKGGRGSGLAFMHASRTGMLTHAMLQVRRRYYARHEG